MLASTDNKSPFQLGTEVAIVYFHFGSRLIKRARVHKVRKDGKFYITRDNGHISEQMWRPETNGTAHQCGARYAREHLVVWSSEIDAELREQAERATAYRNREALITRIRDLSLASAEHRALLEELIKLVPSEDSK